VRKGKKKKDRKKKAIQQKRKVKEKERTDNTIERKLSRKEEYEVMQSSE
jgi:hypothetical protein